MNSTTVVKARTLRPRDEFESGMDDDDIRLWRLIKAVGVGEYEPPAEHREAFARLIELGEKELGL